MINISFEDDALHDCCVDLQRAEQKYGSVHAEALVTFISDAMAFENVSELLDFPGNDLNILPNDSLCVSIGSDYCAILVAVGRRFDRDANGRVVWSTVTRLKLVKISRVP